MAEALVIAAESASERTPLRVRLRWAFHRGRAAILPRRWVIPWEMRDNSRYYTRAMAEAKARKAGRDDIQGLEAEEAHSYWELEEELEMLESNRLQRQATKYFIQPPDWPHDLNDPDGDPNWRRGTTFKPHLYLTRQAMHDLRTKIRAERKARREPVGEWVKIVGATIGGLGGATYLVDKLIKIIP
jgi:hypothetical protein